MHHLLIVFYKITNQGKILVCTHLLVSALLGREKSWKYFDTLKKVCVQQSTLAQLVERLTVDRRTAGSSLTADGVNVLCP